MISIIVCTYNREKYLGETLLRLASNSFDGEWELLVIDNNCSDSTPAICADFLEKHPKVPFRYLVEKQQGLSFARNRGMREAKGDWLVFLDDDAFVEPDYLCQLQDYIRQYPAMDAFGGRIYPFFEDGVTPIWLSKWSQSWLSAIDKGDEVCEFVNDYPIGANMGFTRQMMEKCGYFNTTLGRTGKNLIGGEEKDYFNRIKAENARILYLPKITVQHCIPPSRTSDDYIRRLGEGVGMSERQRTKDRGKKYFFLRLLSEGVKWGGTLVLWVKYCMLLTPQKGNKLVFFRLNVTKGLLSKGL